MHHIKLIQDGDDEDATLVFMAHNNFVAGDPGKKWDVILDPGETTEIVAKAATQTADPIAGITFTWASKDDDVVTVDDGMIEAVRTGSSEITVTAVGRGIAVKFTVTVIAEVKGIVIDSPVDGFFLSNGESVDLKATAYDKATDDGAVAAGSEKVEVDLTYMSSDEDVIEIDGSSAKAVGVGEATITAHYEDVKSKGIKINVTPGGDVTHKLTYTRITAADRKFHIAWSSDSSAVAIYGPGETVPAEAASARTGDGADVVYTVQIRIFDSEGNADVDTDESENTAITTKVQGSSIDNNGISVDITSGIATVTVANSGDGGLAAKALAGSTSNAVVGTGISRIIISYPGADDIALPAITVTEATEAPSATN